MKEDRTIVTFDSYEPEKKASLEPKQAPKQTAVNAFTVDTDIPAEVVRTAEPAVSEVKPQAAEDTAVASNNTPAEASTPPKFDGSAKNKTTRNSYEKKAPAKEASYVTRKFMIACLAIAIIISSALGAGIALAFGSGSAVSIGKHDKNLSDSDLSKATGSELTIAEINDMNENAVVEIVTSGTAQGIFGQMEMVEGAGSGVIVNANGYIVTNYHVIQGANKVTVTLHNGDSYSASIVGGDNENDIAVLKINAKDLKVAVIGDSSTVDVGDLAVAIGNPLGQLGGTCTQGIISALNRRLTVDNRTLDLLQTDSAINPGNSGGGLFNSKGELIGIVESKSSGTGIEGLGFAIPINTVKDEINDLIENGKISGKPSIGISISEVSAENAQYYNLDGEGVYIAEVTGDNAKKAGFQQGDKLLKIDGESFKNSSEFIKKVRSHKVGDTITVTISRTGQEMEIKTVLEEMVTQ